MDLLGDIVEHEIQTPIAPIAPGPSAQGGFPTPSLKKPSRWRQRLQSKGLTSMSGAIESEPKKEDSTFYTTDKSTNLKKFKNSDDLKLDYSNLSEAEHIHQENIEVLSRMTLQEREEAKEELLDTLDPKILQMLIKRSAKKYGPPSKSFDSIKDSIYDPVEGSLGTWVGGEHELDLKNDESKKPTMSKSKDVVSSSASPSSLKSVLKPSNTSSTSSSNDDKRIRFSKEAKVIYLDQSKKVKPDIPSDPESNEWEDIKDVKESSPTPITSSSPINDDAEPTLNDAIKIKSIKTEDIIHGSSNSSGIHFPKPTQPYEELDINDPKFNDKLYEKYFPDLPKNPKQLEWMKSIDNSEIPSEIEYDSIETVRFDFKGNIITNENITRYTNSNVNQGLFNHSQNPELPGYTLPELAHYLRSTFPGQVCIACRTLGRILYKLGTLEYQINEINENNKESELKDKGIEGQFEIQCWKLISELQIIEFLKKYASDNEKNLSIKNYSIDALWLWTNADGDKKLKQFTKSTQ